MINLKPPLKFHPAGFQKLNVCNHQNGQKLTGLGDFLGSESFLGNSYPALFLKKCKMNCSINKKKCMNQSSKMRRFCFVYLRCDKYLDIDDSSMRTVLQS